MSCFHQSDFPTGSCSSQKKKQKHISTEKCQLFFLFFFFLSEKSKLNYLFHIKLIQILWFNWPKMFNFKSSLHLHFPINTFLSQNCRLDLHFLLLTELQEDYVSHTIIQSSCCLNCWGHHGNDMSHGGSQTHISKHESPWSTAMHHYKKM